MSGTSDVSPPTLPAGIWSQPELDRSAVPEMDGVELVQRIRIPARLDYTYTPGAATTRFLYSLKEKKVLGDVCPETGKVYVPPKGVSPVSGLRTVDQVEVGPAGTVTTFCVVEIVFTGQQIETPYVSALVLLDGADTPIYGLIQEMEADKVHMGMRVEPVWVDDAELTTSFENIRWWRPSGEPDVSLDDIREYI